MQGPFEPLLLNLRTISYSSTNNLQDKPKSPRQSPNNRPSKRNRPQTHNPLAQKRERPQTRQPRPTTTIQRIAHLNRTFANHKGASFLRLSLKNPDENDKEKNLNHIVSKLQASKAPLNNVVTLEDLALKRRISNQKQEHLKVNQNQTLDERMILHYQKIDKDIMNRTVDGASFIEYSPIRKTEGSESPNNRTVINESHSIWDAMGKMEKRARATDQQMRIEDSKDSRMNLTFELSRDGKAVDLSLTQDEKVFRKTDINKSKRGKEDMTPSAYMSNTIQSSKLDSTNRVAFGRKGKNLNRSVDKGMERFRLDTLNDSVTVTNDKTSIKKKDEPRKYDGYKQIATEEERERMSKFLKDEYVNEMLMNKYHVDMDKFQIRDAINDIHKKANQDKLLRQKFRDFLKNGIIEAPKEKQVERKPRMTLKKHAYLEVVPLKRKKSETLTSDLSDEPINVIDSSFDITSKEGRRSRETSMDTQKAKSRLGDAFLVTPKRKSNNAQGMKSARSDDDDNTSREDSRDDNTEQQRRELNRIRLMEMKKTLNNKFNKGAREELDEVAGGNTLGIVNRNISEQEQGHAFIKAAKSGDYKTVRKLLIGKPSLVSACDLLKQSALHWAAREGHFEICQILVEYGANVNMTDVGDKTPLYYALKGKYTAIVQLLLSCKTGALAVKTTTFGTLGEGVELLQILKEVQPAIPGSPVKKEIPQRARNYSIRVTQARRESKMAIKLVGLTRIPENV